MSSTLNELWQEFRSVLSGRVPFLDVILPPVVFTILNGRISLGLALAVSLGSAGVLLGIRIWQQDSPFYALSGSALLVLAGGLAWVTQNAGSFFLPGVITSGLTFLGAVISLVLKRPLAAWSSHLTRGWPLDWYWHPRVRPAYTEVTGVWAVFFLAQFLIQGYFFLQGTAQALGLIQLITGWPALILLLAGSYLYGLGRLRRLNGPSVEEFQNGAPPPWEGQDRGF